MDKLDDINTLSFKERLDYKARGEEFQRMNKSRLLHKGRKGQLYVVDFTNKKLLGKGKRAFDLNKVA